MLLAACALRVYMLVLVIEVDLMGEPCCRLVSACSICCPLVFEERPFSLRPPLPVLSVRPTIVSWIGCVSRS